MKRHPLIGPLRHLAAWCRLVDSWHFLQWIVFGGVAAALTAMAVDKVFFLHVEYRTMWLVLGAAGLAALLGYFLLRRIDLRRVSYLIDHAAGLKNLVGTALEVRTHDDEMSRLLVGRAAAAVRQCRARQVYPPRLTWAGRYLAIPAAALIGIYYVPPLDLGGRRAEFQQRQTEQQAVKRGALKLQEKMSRIADESKRPESISGKEITEDLKSLADKLENLDRKQALMEIGEFESKYKKEFGDQRQFEKLTKSLAEQLDETNLAKLSKEELQNLSNSLKAGEFKQAAEAMKQLSKQLQNKELSKEQKQALARELEKLMNNLPGEAPKELAKMLNQMQQGEMKNPQQPEGSQPGQPGEKQPGQSGEKGQPGEQDAASRMNDLAQQMEQLQEMKEMQESLAEAKRDMMGKEGEGEGQGEGSGLNEKSIEEYMEQQAQLGEGEGMGEGQGQGDGEQPGPGMGGRGQGRGGKAPENQTATAFKSELDEGQLNKGKILSHFFVQGVPEKGEALDEYTNAVRSARQDATSSLARNRVPREYEEMVKNYFDEIDLEKKQEQQ